MVLGGDYLLPEQKIEKMNRIVLIFIFLLLQFLGITQNCSYIHQYRTYYLDDKQLFLEQLYRIDLDCKDVEGLDERIIFENAKTYPIKKTHKKIFAKKLNASIATNEEIIKQLYFLLEYEFLKSEKLKFPTYIVWLNYFDNPLQLSESVVRANHPKFNESEVTFHFAKLKKVSIIKSVSYLKDIHLKTIGAIYLDESGEEVFRVYGNSTELGRKLLPSYFPAILTE